jgi:hypothetical protein
MTEKQSRCPACNWIHGGSAISRMQQHEGKKKPCTLCNSTRLVPVSVAERYVRAYYEHEYV